MCLVRILRFQHYLLVRTPLVRVRVTASLCACEHARNNIQGRLRTVCYVVSLHISRFTFRFPSISSTQICPPMKRVPLPSDTRVLTSLWCFCCLSTQFPSHPNWKPDRLKEHHRNEPTETVEYWLPTQNQIFRRSSSLKLVYDGKLIARNLPK